MNSHQTATKFQHELTWPLQCVKFSLVITVLELAPVSSKHSLSVFHDFIALPERSKTTSRRLNWCIHISNNRAKPSTKGTLPDRCPRAVLTRYTLSLLTEFITRKKKAEFCHSAVQNTSNILQSLLHTKKTALRCFASLTGACMSCKNAFKSH